MPVSPTHPDIAVWRAPVEADIDAIHAVFRAADPVDHPTHVTPREEVADVFTLSHIDESRDLILGITAAGEIVAVGASMLHPSREVDLRVHFHGLVHPDWRRRGIGAAVIGWEYARALEQIEAADDSLAASIYAYGEEADQGLVTIAGAHGMQTERWFTSMVRDMAAAVPERPESDGIRVVPFESALSDAARLARNDAFRDHWGSLPTLPEQWTKFAEGPFLRPDLSTLAVDGDRVVAFCLVSVNEDDWAALGASNAYIELIGVVRDYRGRGLAPTAIARSLRAIAAAGLEKAVLDVDTESPTGANTLYSRLGFEPTHRQRALVAHVRSAPDAPATRD